MLTDWIELCELFNAHNVDYLLIGGQAVIAHGYSRLTKDMDLWIRPTADNGRQVLIALQKFGVSPPGFQPSRFEDPKTMLMTGQEPFRLTCLPVFPASTLSERSNKGNRSS